MSETLTEWPDLGTSTPLPQNRPCGQSSMGRDSMILALPHHHREGPTHKWVTLRGGEETAGTLQRGGGWRVCIPYLHAVAYAQHGLADGEDGGVKPGSVLSIHRVGASGDDDGTVVGGGHGEGP